jgi:hypothetical protein
MKNKLELFPIGSFSSNLHTTVFYETRFALAVWCQERALDRFADIEYNMF